MIIQIKISLDKFGGRFLLEQESGLKRLICISFALEIIMSPCYVIFIFLLTSLSIEGYHTFYLESRVKSSET